MAINSGSDWNGSPEEEEEVAKVALVNLSLRIWRFFFIFCMYVVPDYDLNEGGDGYLSHEECAGHQHENLNQLIIVFFSGCLAENVVQGL